MNNSNFNFCSTPYFNFNSWIIFHITGIFGFVESLFSFYLFGIVIDILIFVIGTICILYEYDERRIPIGNHIYIYIYIYIYVCLYVCMYVCMYTHFYWINQLYYLKTIIFELYVYVIKHHIIYFNMNFFSPFFLFFIKEFPHIFTLSCIFSVLHTVDPL